MARAPFKLRSGNASTFKNLGSSPAKQDEEPGGVFASKKLTKTGKTREFPSDRLERQRGTEMQPVRDTKGGTTEGKLKKTGKKRPTINVPKGHPVTPPTDKQSKESKGTVKGLTNFEYDMKPVTNVINKVAKPYKKVGEKVLEVHKKINPIATYKKVKKYFTEK